MHLDRPVSIVGNTTFDVSYVVILVAIPVALIGYFGRYLLENIAHRLDNKNIKMILDFKSISSKNHHETEPSLLSNWSYYWYIFPMF